MKTSGWLFLNLDYAKGKNILLLLVFVFSFSAAKPSSIDKKYRMEGDLQSLKLHFIISLLISVVVYVIMAQHIEKHYVINIISIGVLIGLLMISKSKYL